MWEKIREKSKVSHIQNNSHDPNLGKVTKGYA